jgi:hypothetical protein
MNANGRESETGLRPPRAGVVRALNSDFAEVSFSFQQYLFFMDCAGRAKRRRRYRVDQSGWGKSGVALRLPPHSKGQRHLWTAPAQSEAATALSGQPKRLAKIGGLVEPRP